MAFNADDFLAAHRPWSFTIGGRTFGARHVSAPSVQRFEQLRAAAKDNVRRQQFALWWLLRRAFPWRLSYLIRGDPVKIMLRLPPAAQAEALRDFFACLRGETTASPALTTKGPTHSPTTRRSIPPKPHSPPKSTSA